VLFLRPGQQYQQERRWQPQQYDRGVSQQRAPYQQYPRLAQPMEPPKDVQRTAR
jgi:hypothetical protein